MIICYWEDPCLNSAMMALSLCELLGVSLSTGKEEGPSTTLSFIGILIDTVAMELRLPIDKLEWLKTIAKQKQKHNCTMQAQLSSSH